MAFPTATMLASALARFITQDRRNVALRSLVTMEVLLMALTEAGRIVVLPCQDLAKVQTDAESKVEIGEWRTWDAFDVPSGDGQPRKLVASHIPGEQALQCQ